MTSFSEAETESDKLINRSANVTAARNALDFTDQD
jgi:hypothetical protein